MRYVTYLRVSTKRQGESGLGLEAQRHAIQQYLASVGNGDPDREFVEVESGKRSDNRPQLLAALKQAKVTGSTLVIAKLDRLSRNAAFLLTLRDSGVKFVAADMPQANDLTIGVLAVVAQHEREQISRRVREALAAAKAKGTKLGSPKWREGLKKAWKRGNAPAVAARKAKADKHAENLREVIESLRAEGYEGLQAMANALNERHILTPRSKGWHKSSVANLLKRLEAHHG